MTRHWARKSTVLNEVGRTIVLTMFYLLPDFYCFLNTFLAMFQGFLAQRTIILSQTCWRSTCSSSSDFSPKTTDARGVERAACSPLTSQPLKGLQSLSSLREDHPRTSCLSQYAPSSAGMRDGPEDCVDYVFEGYAGPRLFPLHHDSWTRDFSRSSPGVPTATAGPDNTLQRLFLRGNSKPRLYEHIHRRVAKAPARSNAPAGTRGKCSSHGPALQTKSDPRSPPGARGRGDTRRGGARRGLPPGAEGGRGGSRGTYKSRVPPEEPGRVFGAAAGVGARRDAAATTTTNSRAQNR